MSRVSVTGPHVLSSKHLEDFNESALLSGGSFSIIGQKNRGNEFSQPALKKSLLEERRRMQLKFGWKKRNSKLQQNESAQPAEISRVTWVASQSVRATHSPDGCVLLDIERGLCYSLNVVAAHMWLAIEANQTGVTLEEIVSALASKFSVSREELETDAVECLEKLEQMGLVQRKSEDTVARSLGRET